MDDELTGLHDRRSFLLALRRQIGYANDRKTSLALIIVDIDGFAGINNAHGYAFGDKTLQYLAQQLRQVARAHDYIARIGDNRFALILPQIMNRGHAELAVQKLLRLLELPFEQGQVRIRLQVTVGAALCPLHATHAEFLLRLAEREITSARALGQPWLILPEEEKEEGLSEFWDMEIELAGAVQRGEMVMH